VSESLITAFTGRWPDEQLFTIKNQLIIIIILIIITGNINNLTMLYNYI